MLDNWMKLNDESRVWVYQSKTVFSTDLELKLLNELDDFVIKWAAHGQNLKAAGAILEHQFIVLFVDESYYSASGCSIDSSVRFIEDIEKKYQLNLSDRMQVLYLNENGNKEITHLNKLKDLLSNKQISEDTIVFDNLVKNKKQITESWKKPLKDSWLKRFV